MVSENIFEKNQKIVDEIALDKGLSINTINSYRSILNEYSTFHKMSLSNILEEAYYDEEKGIILKKRRIKQRMITYKRFLISKNNQPLTINTKIAKIKSFYKFYDVEVPYIPLLIKKQHETINDIPTKDDISLVINNTTNLRFKAIVLFLLSSGNSLNETINLTIGDFISATDEYHKENNIKECINVLEKNKNVIPTFYMHRQKTNYPYISFCSNEATHSIITYLKNRIKKEGVLIKKDKLFNIEKISVQAHFRRINDKLDFGYSGQYRFFHAHALRKYFATQLLKAELDSITIDFLSGRSVNRTRQAYFKADPEKLKQKYMEVVNSLIINNEYLINNSKRDYDVEYFNKHERYYT